MQKKTNPIKNAVRPIYEQVLTAWIRLTDPPKGTHPVVIQGIQRSGTNYLLTLLERADYYVLNKTDPHRKKPRHKHCRWQDDKSTIKMEEQYLNSYHASSIGEVNSISKWPPKTKHVVLFRSPEKWLNSIYRWGLQNNWFPDEDTFFQNELHKTYLEEWDAFYSFWQDRAKSEPNSVLLVPYERLVKAPLQGLTAIDQFLGVERDQNNTIAEVSIEKVRHSTPITEKRHALNHDELRLALQQPRTFKWQDWQEAFFQ